MIEHADKHGAIPYFVSVGIANADGTTEAEMAIPIKGSGFHAAYEGMIIIARSNRVKIWNEKGITNVTRGDVEK
jgi:hypothetical protein